MKLHQLKVEYDAEQDRLIMLVATSELVELRLALTRRFVKLLWPLLVKLAEEASPRIRTQANPEARKALLGLEHEHAVSKADFSKPYDAGEASRPLGDQPLLPAVRDLGYTTPTPVQEQAIPLVLAGRDLMAGAQTGTGKTAAFALPILQRLAPQASTSTSPARHPVRALVLTPTRELAVQVAESFRDYGRHVPLRSTVVYGGVDMNAQIAELRRGVEVLVATPGRLLDHVQNKTVMFNQVGVLVLDEADRMLDMGFLPDIKRIIALLPQERQNLLFSATFPDEIRTLAKTLLRNPAEITVTPRNVAAELVTHVVHPVAREKKRDLLAYIIQTPGLKQALGFSGTRIGAHRLPHPPRLGPIQADAIHGDKTQAERELALADFKAGKTAVLVATDVASRGLDIEGLPQVINFDVPRSPEDYVHRIGRTGRAGLTGEAISLVAPEDMESLAAIERLIKKRLD